MRTPKSRGALAITLAICSLTLSALTLISAKRNERPPPPTLLEVLRDNKDAFPCPGDFTFTLAKESMCLISQAEPEAVLYAVDALIRGMSGVIELSEWELIGDHFIKEFSNGPRSSIFAVVGSSMGVGTTVIVFRVGGETIGKGVGRGTVRA